MPTSVAVAGVSESVSVSTARMPVLRARSSQTARASRSCTSSYRCSTSAGGAGRLRGALAGSAKAAGAPLAGAADGVEEGSAPSAMVPSLRISASTRLTMVRKPWALRKSISFWWSGSRTRSSSSGFGTGAWSSSRTRRREIRACSAKSISFWRRAGCLISLARASSDSRSPYSVMSWAAVFTPMPGTPGTLSTLSPARACTSTTLSGATPNFSNTSPGPMGLFFSGSSIRTPGRTSCIMSLSDDTMVTSRPASFASRA